MAGKIDMMPKLLKRLTKENSLFLKSKKIFFAGFSSSNIEFFIECFPYCINNISGIFAILDIDDRTPLTVSVKEETYTVKPLSKINSVNNMHSVIIILYEYEKEACEKLLNILENRYMPIYWFPDKQSEVELKYRDKFIDNSVDNVILFKSGSRQYVYGDDFSDNSKALFEYMVKKGYNKRWKLVWLVYDPECNEYDLWKQYENVEFISTRDSETEDTKKKDIFFQKWYFKNPFILIIITFNYKET